MNGPLRRFALPARLALAAVVVALVAWRSVRSPEAPLPPTIVSEEIVTELSDHLDPAAIVTQAAGDPPRAAELRPGDPLLGQGARPGLVTPAPCRLRFRVDVPADGVLTFAVGVQGDGQRNRARSGVRFAVAVNGHELWTRAVNPAASRMDRRWFDERVDLRAVAGRAVDVELITEAESPAQPLSGTAGWGTVRLVRETRHPRQRAGPDRPNVLVLLVDTLRADGLGTYGASPSPSPNLDRFAADGLVFEQAIAQAPWTLPSVATLFTGVHPRSHGAIGETGDAAAHAAWGFLADGVDTIADLAIRAGITTFGVSTNPMVSRGTNLAQGFEEFVELPWSQEQRNWAPAASVNRVFADWLARNRGWRFLAYLHYMEPHDPYTPPPAFRPAPPPGMRGDLAAGWVLDVSQRIATRGDIALPADQVAYLRALYDGEIRAWDAELPGLLDVLDRSGVRDSTVVIVTADHGEEFMEHGQLRHRKHLYEESIRVPLLMVGPGVPRGRRAEQAQGIDLHPTLAALLGLDAADGLPGRSLLETLPARAALSETMSGLTRDGQRGTLVAARTPAWKVIDAPEPAADECFDLARDPAERTPLPPESGHGPGLRTALDDFARGAAPAPVHAGYDPELRDKLRALGYAD
jgi:arylsulfatase A-like enzyme